MKELRTLDLNLLKAFHALMEEKSVSLAAQRLALTQPAMSGTLARLRDSFDDPLFLRAQRGIQPTTFAEQLAPQVKQILDQVEALLKPPVFDPLTAEMTMNIAATDYAMRAVLLPFLQLLQQAAPNIKVAAFALDESTLAGQLAQGKLDFALTTPDFQAADIHAKPLYDEHYLCAMRADHPLAETTLDITAFCQANHALVSYHGGGFSGVTDQTLTQLNQRRNVTLSVQNFLILPDILRTTDLIAVLPARLLNGISGLKTAEPPIPVQGFTKTLVWHARTHRDPAFIWLRELIGRACK
ncbi:MULTISPECIES: LysR family transcriptional regulator [Pasteurellaceae]|uniref:LysR family transcriptional regulator n=1 Tax=Pasteurellaceae TaxID=712 RepID=UPI0035628CF1